MATLKPLAKLEIRASRPAASDPDAAAPLEPAVQQATAQTPEGSTSEVAFVLAWLHGATFSGRVTLARHRYAGLQAELIELFNVPNAPRLAPELVALAQGVRARASMADVHELLAGTQARIAALLSRTSVSPRGRR